MLVYQQSETTAERRRWMLHLVDATDGITALTGITGQGKLSKNGATPVSTTNSLVEVDSTNMPGFYYIELTAGELDTLGFLGFRFKTAATAEFQDRAIISYNDPYVSAGGFSGSTTVAGGITKKQLELLAELVWKYKFSDEKTAQETLVEAAVEPVLDLTAVESKIAALEFPETDLTPVLDSINSISFPKQKDYTKLFADLNKAVQQGQNINLGNLKQIVLDFENKMGVTSKDVEVTAGTVSEIKTMVNDTKTLLDEFNSKLAEMSDMDKRFENMTSVMQKQSLDQQQQAITDLADLINNMMKKLLLAMTNSKFEILSKQLR